MWLFLVWIASANAAKPLETVQQNGRFQVLQISDQRRDQFMIDTWTGQLWTRRCSDESHCAWTKELVDGVNTDMDRIGLWFSAVPASK